MITNKISLLASVAFFAFRPFDPGTTPGWKVVDGKIEMKDGNPVYIQADGTEATLQADTVSRLNREAQQHRLAKEKLETELAKFKDIDPDKARKALELTSKLDQKQLIDAGKVDEVKNEITKQYEKQLAETREQANTLQSRLDQTLLQHRFVTSAFAKDKLAIPVDMTIAAFGKNFKIEDGKLTPIDNNGNVIYSKKNIGEVADFEEGLEAIVLNYPHKDAILKGGNHSGTGNTGGGGNGGGSRTITRQQFEALTPMERADTAKAMQEKKVVIVD